MDIDRGVRKEFFDMSEQAYTYVILGGRLAGASAIQGIRGLDPQSTTNQRKDPLLF